MPDIDGPDAGRTSSPTCGAVEELAEVLLHASASNRVQRGRAFATQILHSRAIRPPESGSLPDLDVGNAVQRASGTQSRPRRHSKGSRGGKRKRRQVCPAGVSVASCRPSGAGAHPRVFLATGNNRRCSSTSSCPNGRHFQSAPSLREEGSGHIAMFFSTYSWTCSCVDRRDVRTCRLRGQRPDCRHRQGAGMGRFRGPDRSAMQDAAVAKRGPLDAIRS